MTLQAIPASGNSVTPAQENFDVLEVAAVFGKDATTTTGLTWGYLSGRWGGIAITAGTVTLTNAADNYVVVARDTGVVTTSTATTNWNNTADYARLYKLTAAGNVVTVTEDHRSGPYGIHGGPPTSIPQNSQSAAYTTVLKDAGKHILHPAADNNARTFTIDSNANVPYPLGTAITFVNKINVVTIAITSDTLTWAEDGSTGNRSLAANGIATALKIASTEWLISGVGLT